LLARFDLILSDKSVDVRQRYSVRYRFCTITTLRVVANTLASHSVGVIHDVVSDAFVLADFISVNIVVLNATVAAICVVVAVECSLGIQLTSQ